MPIVTGPEEGGSTTVVHGSAQESIVPIKVPSHLDHHPPALEHRRLIR